MKARVGLALDFNVNVEAERTSSGEYLVTLRGGAMLGAEVKADTELGKGTASGMAGGRGAVTLKFKTAGEAADTLAAMHQRAAASHRIVAGSQGALRWAGVLDKDMDTRTIAAARYISQFEGSAVGRLKGEVDAIVVKAGITGELGRTLRVDLEAGKLVYEATGRVSGEAQLKSSLASFTVEHALFRSALEGSLSVRGEMRLSAEELKKIGRGELSAGDLFDAQRFTVQLYQQVKGEYGGAHFTARREIGDLADLVHPLDPTADWEVNAGMKTRVAVSVDREVKVGSVKVKGTVEQSVIDGGTRRTNLATVLDELTRSVAERDRAQTTTAARQAFYAAQR